MGPFFLAQGGQSCTQACKDRGNRQCDAAALEAAAQSMSVCKKIVELWGGKTPQEGSDSPDDNSGCTYHPGDQGWYQLMRKDADPECAAVNSDPSRQRICSCL